MFCVHGSQASCTCLVSSQWSMVASSTEAPFYYFWIVLICSIGLELMILLLTVCHVTLFLRSAVSVLVWILRVCFRLSSAALMWLLPRHPPLHIQPKCLLMMIYLILSVIFIMAILGNLCLLFAELFFMSFMDYLIQTFAAHRPQFVTCLSGLACVPKSPSNSGSDFIVSPQWFTGTSKLLWVILLLMMLSTMHMYTL